MSRGLPQYPSDAEERTRRQKENDYRRDDLARAQDNAADDDDEEFDDPEAVERHIRRTSSKEWVAANHPNEWSDAAMRLMVRLLDDARDAER